MDSRDEDIYVKGSWVLHSLRYVIDNDSLFFDIVKTFRVENHQKQIFSETFTELVNEKTKKDYSWFFKQYIYNREAPILEYVWLRDKFYYRWANTGKDFTKISVELSFDDEKIKIYPTDSTQVYTLTTKGKRFYFLNQDKVYYGYKQNSRLYFEQ